MMTSFSLQDFTEALDIAPTLELPHSAAGSAGLTLDRFLKLSAELPGPRRITIVVTRWVYGAFTIPGDDGELYILTDHAAVERIVAEFPAIPSPGLSALTGIPVVYDDDLAAQLILKAITIVPALPPSPAGALE